MRKSHVLWLLALGCDDKVAAPRLFLNSPPAAAAGADQVVAEGTTVALTATASQDVDGDPLTYLWQQTAGASVTLSDVASSTPTFVAPQLTGDVDTDVLRLQLTVTDIIGASASASVIVTVYDLNRRPEANATADFSAAALAQVTLSAQGSDDADGEIVAYVWSQAGGASATIGASQALSTVVTLPDLIAPETLTFTLEVTDGEGKQDVATTTVSVAPVPAQLAFVGLPTSIEAYTLWPDVVVQVRNASGARIQEGADAAVTLELVVGDGLLSGVQEVNASAGSATFADLFFDGVGDIQLRATAGDLEELSSEFDIVESHARPTAGVTGPNEANAGDQVMLTATTGDDGAVESRVWAQLSGPTVTLDVNATDANTSVARFVAPEVAAPTTISFRFRAIDDGDKIVDADINVTVQPVAVDLAFVTAPPVSVVVDSVWDATSVEVRNASGKRITSGDPATYAITLESDSGTLAAAAAISGVAMFTPQVGAITAALSVTPTVATPALSGEPASVRVWPRLPGAFGDANSSVVVNTAAAIGDGFVLGGWFSGGPLGFDPARGVGTPLTTIGVAGFVARYDSDGTLVWVRQIDGVDAEAEVKSVVVTDASDVIVAVRYHGSVDFDDSNATALAEPHGGDDIALAAFDGNSSALEWVVTVGDNLDDVPWGLALFDGGILVAGSFAGLDVNLEPCGTALYDAPDDDAVVLLWDLDKLAGCSGAALRWAASWGAGGADRARAIAAAADRIYAVGSVASSVDFPVGVVTPSVGATGAGFLAALDANGSTLWVRAAAAGTAEFVSVATDSEGNVFAAGRVAGAGFIGTASVDVSTQSSFVTSCTVDGVTRLGWPIVLAGDAENAPAHVVYAQSGPVVVGAFRGELSLSGGASALQAGAHTAGYAMGLDANASILWAEATGADDANVSYSAAAIGAASVWVVGTASGSGDLALDPDDANHTHGLRGAIESAIWVYP